MCGSHRHQPKSSKNNTSPIISGLSSLEIPQRKDQNTYQRGNLNKIDENFD